MYIYLPPGYDETAGRFPVLYLLHGFQSLSAVWFNGFYGFSVADLFDEHIRAAKCPKMLVVMPDVRSRSGGGWYADSSNGRWESFIVRDLVSAIDAQYRTKADARYRGLAGHSMGGHGAIRIGMRHPDVFTSVYALAPGVLGFTNEPFKLTTLIPEYGTWRNGPLWTRVLSYKSLDDLHADRLPTHWHYLFVAIAGAWSPNPNAPLYCDFPYQLGLGGTLVFRPEVFDKWRENDPVQMAERYTDNLRRIRLRFECGFEDSSEGYAGARRLHAVLERLGVQHEFEDFDGTHMNRVYDRLATKMIPFFNAGWGNVISPVSATGTTTMWGRLKTGSGDDAHQ